MLSLLGVWEFEGGESDWSESMPFLWYLGLRILK